MRTIKNIFRFIKIFKKLTYSPTVIVQSDWSEADAKNLQSFFNTSTGERFTKHISNLEAENNARAVIETKNITYNAGAAFGGRCMVAHIFALPVNDPLPQTEDEYDTYRDESALDEVDKLLAQHMN